MVPTQLQKVIHIRVIKLHKHHFKQRTKVQNIIFLNKGEDKELDYDQNT